MHFVPGRFHGSGSLKSTSNSCFVRFSQRSVFSRTYGMRWLTHGTTRCYIVPTVICPPIQRTTIMAHTDRRQFLKDFLAVLAQGTGTIVLASVATAHDQARVTGSQNTD